MIDIYLCDDEDMIRRQIRDAIEKKIMIESYDMRVVSSTGKPGDRSEARSSPRRSQAKSRSAMSWQDLTCVPRVTPCSERIC